ncbi:MULTISPECIES: Uma2 family endonuclease [unclassified Moorena]|uniref:Uma2 family endonuclease n=1 Tax=unclassified Moorena TaxID=2683338 RepID=UPI0013B79A64|nr:MULTISPECIES: Uma2 family endonuclease [unclassified Moorena]NER91814.1 Uma2 family endonuclease [Moorena sp. SIO3A2]NES45194.1 Uma2 family endonuclease [Moorena sp. SIO2C4]
MTKNWIPQSEAPASPKETLPTMYDLPSENPEEPGLPDEFHDLQPELLSRTFRCQYYPSEEVFIGTDLNLYYDVRHPQWYKRPDWFLVVGVPRLYEGTDIRSSYVIWQEGVNPFVIVELLSPTTAKDDLGDNLEQESEASRRVAGNSDKIQLHDSNKTSNSSSELTHQTIPSKWEVYEQRLRVPYYLVFSRYTNQIRFFKLVGAGYQEQGILADPPQIWIPELDIGVGLWWGEYAGITRNWLRWCDGSGNWLLTDTEQEREAKEQAQQQVKQIVVNLLKSGMDIEQVANITGLDREEIRELAGESDGSR